MKILLFCNLNPAKEGAYEALVAAIGQTLQAGGNGDEIDRVRDAYIPVFAAAPIPAVTDRLRKAGLRWDLLPGWNRANGLPRTLPFVRHGLRLLRKHRPDVVAVHFGNELPTLILALLARLGGRRKTAWIWEQDQQIRDPPGMTSRINKLRLLDLAGFHFLAVYDGGRESMRKRGIPDPKISVIYNAVADQAPRKSRASIRADLDIGPDAVVTVMTGWLIPRKQVHAGIDAFAAATSVNRHVPAVLLIVGDGPLREELETRAAHLERHVQVRFLGQRNDVRDLLAAADVFLHTSMAETCTYAITEALCAGLPPVVWESGAAREQIQDGVSGYVLPQGDRNGLAAKLALLIGDGDRRKTMGEAARERWNARYRIEDAAAAYATLYRETVLSKKV